MNENRKTRKKQPLDALKPEDRLIISKGTREVLAFMKRLEDFHKRSKKSNPVVG